MGTKNKNLKNSLGAKWNASHLVVRLCALRHWKRISMPPTTQSLRHPLTRVFHFAPRIKTARRFTAKKMMQFAVEHAKGLSLRYDAPSPIVADKNHRIRHEKSPRRWLRGLGEGLFDVVLVQDEVDEGGYVAHINFSVAVDVGFSGHWLGAENHID